MPPSAVAHSPAPPPPRDDAPSATGLRQLARDESKRAYLRMVSHELRTPLNSIIGFSEIIARELYGPINEPRYREHAEIVRASGLKLLKLVNQIMDIARLEAGAADLDLRPEALQPAVEDAMAAVREEALARGLSFRLDAQPGLPPVLADSKGLKTILINLLQNAVAHSPAGGEVAVTLRTRSGSMLIEVRDQGEAVEPAELSRLMRPLEQGEAAMTRRSEGVGLSLPIVRLLCSAMDGHFRLQVCGGGGLIAAVRLPVAEPESPPRPA